MPKLSQKEAVRRPEDEEGRYCPGCNVYGKAHLFTKPAYFYESWHQGGSCPSSPDDTITQDTYLDSAIMSQMASQMAKEEERVLDIEGEEEKEEKQEEVSQFRDHAKTVAFLPKPATAPQSLPGASSLPPSPSTTSSLHLLFLRYSVIIIKPLYKPRMN